LRSSLGQATYTYVPLSPSGISWYRPMGVISLAERVTTGLMERNSSLPPGLWLMLPAADCQETGSARAQRLVIEYRTNLLLQSSMTEKNTFLVFLVTSCSWFYCTFIYAFVMMYLTHNKWNEMKYPQDFSSRWSDYGCSLFLCRL